MIKYFIIAGEASGDMHAAALIAQIKEREPSAVFYGMGGDKMRDAGCNLVQDYRNMAFMGFAAVLANLGKVRKNFRIAHFTLMEEQPDVLILVDYPSFNLSIAKFVKKHLPTTKVVYYVPPKVWAWKTWRVHKIAKLSDKVLGIFPFEEAFFAQYGYKCEYVGNPTEEMISAWKAEHKASLGAEDSRRKNIIAVLPGSRPHEIEKCLPKMLEAARRFPQNEVHVAMAPGIRPEFYETYLQGEKLRTDTYQLLSEARAAVVNSGTATLETALLDCPEVAVYHIALGRLAGLVRPIVFRIPFFTLVNIISNKEVIKELLAYLFTADNVAAELQRLLDDDAYKNAMLANFNQIRCLLGENTTASVAAERIVEMTK